jgi:CHASE3 domain sensor protein
MFSSSLDGAAHLVQLALTPIFLLTGLASLLNVFSTRLGRVADRVDRLTADAEAHPRQLRILRLRSRILDVAVVLVAAAGALTCGAALTLFFGELRNANGGILLFALFGLALLLSVLALAAFALETLLSGRSIREEATGRSESAGTPRPQP